MGLVSAQLAWFLVTPVEVGLLVVAQEPQPLLNGWGRGHFSRMVQDLALGIGGLVLLLTLLLTGFLCGLLARGHKRDQPFHPRIPRSLLSIFQVSVWALPHIPFLRHPQLLSRRCLNSYVAVPGGEWVATEMNQKAVSIACQVSGCSCPRRRFSKYSLQEAQAKALSSLQ